MHSVRELRQKFEKITPNNNKKIFNSTYTLSPNSQGREKPTTLGDNMEEKDFLKSTNAEAPQEGSEVKNENVAVKKLDFTENNVEDQKKEKKLSIEELEPNFHNKNKLSQKQAKDEKLREDILHLARDSSFDEKIFENRKKLYNNYVQTKRQLFELQTSATQALQDIHKVKNKFNLDDDSKKGKLQKTKHFNYADYVKEKLVKHSEKVSEEKSISRDSKETEGRISPPKAVVKPSSKSVEEDRVDESSFYSVNNMKSFWDKISSPRREETTLAARQTKEHFVVKPLIVMENSRVTKTKEKSYNQIPWRSSSRNSFIKSSPRWNKKVASNEKVSQSKPRRNAGRNSTQSLLLDISYDSVNSFNSAPSPYLRDEEIEDDKKINSVSTYQKDIFYHYPHEEKYYGNRSVIEENIDEAVNSLPYTFSSHNLENPVWIGSFQTLVYDDLLTRNKEKQKELYDYLDCRKQTKSLMSPSFTKPQPERNTVSVLNGILKNKIQPNLQNAKSVKESCEKNRDDKHMTDSENEKKKKDKILSTLLGNNSTNSQILDKEVEKDDSNSICKPLSFVQEHNTRMPQLVLSGRSEKKRKNQKPADQNKAQEELLEKKIGPRKKYNYDIHGRKVYITPNGTEIPMRYLETNFIKDLSTRFKNYWEDVSQEASELGAKKIKEMGRSRHISPITCLNKMTTGGEKEIHKKVQEKIQHQLIEGIVAHAESKYNFKQIHTSKDSKENYDFYLKTIKAKLKSISDERSKFLLQKRELDGYLHKSELELKLQHERLKKAVEEKINAFNEGRAPTLPKAFVVSQEQKCVGLGALIMKASSNPQKTHSVQQKLMVTENAQDNSISNDGVKKEKITRIESKIARNQKLVPKPN